MDFNDEKRVRIDYMKTGVICYHMITELLEIYRGELRLGSIKFMIDYMMKTKNKKKKSPVLSLKSSFVD
ncbi:MAG: hypothetical protein IKS48_04000 [Eubacterium sp.]|nr:hypothetical protein [Eubacterium sp.]